MFIQPEYLTEQNDHLTQVKARLCAPPSRLLAADLGVDFIFLCYTNRTGSNLLAHLLASTGACNSAGEYFNWDIVVDTARAFQLPDLTAYVEHVVAHDAVDGRLVMKTDVTQLAMLAAYGILERILPRSRFILIERLDKVAQTVSWVMTLQTQQWSSEQEARMPEEALTYQFDWLHRDLRGLLDVEAEMRKFLALNAISPLHVTYEALTAAPVGVTQKLLAGLGLGHLRPDPARVGLRSQSSPTKTIWRDRFAADLRAV